MERMEEILRQTATKLQAPEHAGKDSQTMNQSKFRLRNNSVIQKLKSKLSKKIIYDEAEEDYHNNLATVGLFRTTLDNQLSQKLRLKSIVDKYNSI